MYIGVGGATSMDGRVANISFASFLKDRVHNPSNAAFQQFHTRLGHPLPAQTANTSKDTLGGYTDPLFKHAAVRAAFAQHPHAVLPFAMMAQEQAYFKEYVRDTDDLFLPTNLVALPPAFQPSPLAGSLWSEDTYHPAFAHPPTLAPLKTDHSPALPTPSVLPRQVDVSKYENVSYEDWYRAPTLYESSSPSTVEYQHSSPATPEDTYSDYSVNLHPDHDIRPYQFPAASFSSSSKGVPDMAHSQSFNTSSMANYSAQHMFHGLPSANLVNTAPHAHPIYVHHHSLQKSEPHSSDLDIESSVASEDDADEGSSPASISSHRFVHAKDDIAGRQKRDEFVVKMRNEGHSYRDIKRFGRFKEAESTLRGRYRALTKDREERVRKPQWQSNDVALLRQAVRYYSHGVNKKLKMSHGRRKLPWKKISQRMLDHGSSYDFAPATCARKWEELAKVR